MAFDRSLLPDPLGYYESQGLTLIGPRSAAWRTTACGFHGGSDSMRIAVVTGGFICMACNAKGGDVLAYHMAATGMSFVEAARTLGAWTEDGKPPPRGRPTALSPRDALRVLAVEATIVAVAATDIATGHGLSKEDAERTRTAAARIARVAEDFA